VTLIDVIALVGALLVSTLLLVAVVAAVWWFDRYDREPLHLVVGVFLWGALAAPVIAVFGSSALAAGSGSDSIVMAVWIGPLVEEVAKAFGVILVVLLSKEFDNPTDGLVYGTAAGLGFAATENLVYTLAGVGESALGGTLLLVFIRTALAAGIHALSSATFGGFLGFAYLSRNRGERLTWLIVGLVGAVAIHAGWNFMLLQMESSDGAVPVARWFVVVPALYAFYFLGFVGFLRSEQRILGVELAEEVEFNVVPAWVVEVIPYYRRRIRSDWWPSRSERTVLARLLTRLAFRKHAVRRLPDEESQLAGLEVVRLRQQIRAKLQCQSSVEEEDLTG
jgi:RsiW-degrading membrane proteinase PrsW (M82 family)